MGIRWRKPAGSASRNATRTMDPSGVTCLSQESLAAAAASISSRERMAGVSATWVQVPTKASELPSISRISMACIPLAWSSPQAPPARERSSAFCSMRPLLVSK
jgi:hypothetical protein